MYDEYQKRAWRSDEQLINESLHRAFGDPPKIDDKFAELLDKLGDDSGVRSTDKD